MASVATKRQAENKSYKIKYKALKELNFNVEKEYVFNKKQTLISNFFLKQ